MVTGCVAAGGGEPACAFGAVAAGVCWASVAAGGAVVCEVPGFGWFDVSGWHEADGFGAGGVAGLDGGCPLGAGLLVGVAVAALGGGAVGLHRSASGVVAGVGAGCPGGLSAGPVALAGG